MGKRVFLKACLQVDAFVRPEKTAHPRPATHSHGLKKDICI